MQLVYRLVIFFVVALATVAVSAAQGTCAYFGRPTDTILISGPLVETTQMTLEFRVAITGPGLELFRSFQDSEEDKHVGVGPNGVSCGVSPLYTYGFVEAALNLDDSLHDIAYVYDGSHQRLYVDGLLVDEVASSGAIGNGTNPIAELGAIADTPSFNGYLQAFKVSKVARYSGAAYNLPSSYSSDAQTQLLYRFDEDHNRNSVSDLSGNGHTGTFGAGISGGTSPILGVAFPSSKPVSGLTANAGSTSAQIGWTTPVSGSDGIEYGTSTEYGGFVAGTAMSKAPIITISQLQPNTNYHYRVRSTDVSGNQYVSPDSTFTTAKELFGTVTNNSLVLKYSFLRSPQGTYLLNFTLSGSLYWEIFEFGGKIGPVLSTNYDSVPTSIGFVGTNPNTHVSSTVGGTLVFPKSAGAPGTTVDLQVILGAEAFPVTFQSTIEPFTFNVNAKLP